jgi:hypothetical protein
MPDGSNSEAHSAPRMTVTRVPWWVASLRVLGGYRLAVEFGDGTAGEADLRELIFAADAGVFEQLRDSTVFDQAFIEDGAVTWPNGLDLAPDAMYDVIRSGAIFTG